MRITEASYFEEMKYQRVCYASIFKLRLADLRCFCVSRGVVKSEITI
jgi:hypothetical protein